MTFWTIMFIAYAILIFGIVRLLRSRRRQQSAPAFVTHNLKTGTVTPTKETDAGKLWGKIMRNECPECGATDWGFHAGPEGGMSQNIECANDKCGARFNVTPMIGIAERI